MSTTYLTSNHIARSSDTCVQSSALLSLPPEIRHLILALLLPSHCLKILVVRSLFIRKNFRNVYMATQPKTFMSGSLSVLRVCHQLTVECLPLLYGLPMWRCATRLNELGSQIGTANVSFTRTMEIGYEDMASVAERCTDGAADRDCHVNNGGGLRFDSLEVLETDGHQAGIVATSDPNAANHAPAITRASPVLTLSARTKRFRARAEAKALLSSARTILSVHPLLTVLVQSGPTCTGGGGDAIELGPGRVKWRFLRHEKSKRDDEHVVDLEEVIETLRGVMRGDGTWTTSYSSKVADAIRD